MRTTKVAITLDARTLEELDQLVRRHVFPSRSSAIQSAVQEKLTKLRRARLAEECAKLDPKEEQALADEGLSQVLVQWPEY